MQSRTAADARLEQDTDVSDTPAAGTLTIFNVLPRLYNTSIRIGGCRRHSYFYFACIDEKVLAADSLNPLPAGKETMINEEYISMLGKKSVIRELSEYATARAKEIGAENVYDFSLGNPSVPTPQSFDDTIIDLVKTMDSMSLHGYSPSNGLPEAKQQVADSLNRRFDLQTIFSRRPERPEPLHMRCVQSSGRARRFWSLHLTSRNTIRTSRSPARKSASSPQTSGIFR